MLEMSEYEQQMVAAGFIPVESLDDEYQEYLDRRGDEEFEMSYQSWLNAKRRLDELGEAYKTEIEPLYKDYDNAEWTPELNNREDYLMREISHFEQLLRY